MSVDRSKLETPIPEGQWRVPAELGGSHLDRIVREQFPERSWSQVRSFIRGGNVLVDRVTVLDATAVIDEGREVVVTAHPKSKKEKTSASKVVTAPKLLVYFDSQLVIVEKPTGISTVPYDQTERDTLDRRVMAKLARGKSRAKILLVHRIDKETTGLLVFARTQHAQERLKSQFRFHSVERKYYALVHGHVKSRTISSYLVKDRGDGLRGSTDNEQLGRKAVTHVRLVEQLAGASLVECQLETGRTHQIRIHLSEAGHPLLGERVYSKSFKGSLLPAARVMLHAASLGFDHPSEDGRRLSYESPLPADFEQRLQQLRK